MSGERAVEQAFADERRLVWAVGYRMTASAADADDIVQETFARALTKRPDTSRPLRPWLLTVATNLARDQLRRRRRRSYLGPWLPEPLRDDELAALDVTSDDVGAEVGLRMRESASFAYLVACEALTPGQRAVMLLRDVLELSGRETAAMLDMSETNVKVTLHRARKALARFDVTRTSPVSAAEREHGERVLGRFLTTALAGDRETLLELLAEDARSASDANGLYSAATRVVEGKERVATLMTGLMRLGGDGLRRTELVWVNHTPAVWIEREPKSERDAPFGVVLFPLDDQGRVRGVFSVYVPEKLLRASPP